MNINGIRVHSALHCPTNNSYFTVFLTLTCFLISFKSCSQMQISVLLCLTMLGRRASAFGSQVANAWLIFHTAFSPAFLSCSPPSDPQTEPCDVLTVEHRFTQSLLKSKPKSMVKEVDDPRKNLAIHCQVISDKNSFTFFHMYSHQTLSLHSGLYLIYCTVLSYRSQKSYVRSCSQASIQVFLKAGF